ncbi:hypothetical protein ACFTAO_03405 [Paenibacillus rhizoplanae]
MSLDAVRRIVFAQESGQLLPITLDSMGYNPDQEKKYPGRKAITPITGCKRRMAKGCSTSTTRSSPSPKAAAFC